VSEPKPPITLDPKAAALLGFVERDFKRFESRARHLRANLAELEGDISEDILVHQQLLEELTRKLLLVSSNIAEQDVELALKTAVVALKCHAEFREFVTPIARRLGEQIRAQKALAVSATRSLTDGAERKALTSGAARGSGHGHGTRRGRRARPARAEADTSEERSAGAVDGRLLGISNGQDPETGRPVIWTMDERDKEHPIKPFPENLDYLHYLVELLDNPPEPLTVIEKSSQVMATTTIMLHSSHDCALHSGRKVMLSKHKEAEAEAILRDKVRFPWSQMPSWLQRALPISKTPANRVTWTNTNSMIWGLTENAAAAEARGNTYTRGLIDEGEYQDGLQALITAMRPRTEQVVLWSTPAIGGHGASVTKRLLATT